MTKKIDHIREILSCGENANFTAEDLQELTDKEVWILLIRFSQWRQAIKAESVRRSERSRVERQAQGIVINSLN